MVHLTSNSMKLVGRKARKQASKKHELKTLIWRTQEEFAQKKPHVLSWFHGT